MSLCSGAIGLLMFQMWRNLLLACHYHDNDVLHWHFVCRQQASPDLYQTAAITQLRVPQEGKIFPLVSVTGRARLEYKVQPAPRKVYLITITL